MARPKPFRRPSIEIGSVEKRAWQWVPPQSLAVGDTVADFGTITRIVPNYYPQSSSNLIVDGIELGKYPGYFEIFREQGYGKVLYPTDVVFAYTRVPQGNDHAVKE